MAKPIIKLLSAILCTVMIFSCAQEPVNLISNSGFETGEGENPEGWQLSTPRGAANYQAGVDKTEFFSGQQSFKVSRVWSYPRRSVSLRSATPVPIDAGKNYILSFYYKTKDINEYPVSLSAQFTVKSDSTPSVRYSKSMGNVEDWQQYFVILDNMPADARELELSFGFRPNSKGSVWIDDVVFREASPKDMAMFEKWRRQPIPQAAGKAGNKKFEATGFFRVEKADDRWWIVDPEGMPTWGFQTSGTRVVPNPDNPATQTEQFKKEYGTTVREASERLYTIFMDECGFNSLAGWSADEHAQISRERHQAGKPYMPMTRVLGLASASRDPNAFAKDREGNLLNRSGHEVPDPFSPVWRKAAREKAERLISVYRDDPTFFGWFVDNEMSFEELFRYIWAEASSAEFIKYLQGKYPNIAALNQAWTSKFKTYNYSSFNDILADKPEPAEWDDPAWPDFAAFERQMMKEYIDYSYDLIKELDPNHLVLSNRINLGPMPDIHRTIDLWGRYDIVCMNIYPDNNKIGFQPGELEIMRKLHEGTGRPIIIGEWSVPAIDSKLYEFGVDPLGRPLDWSWPQVLRTQKERGETYDICIRQLASLDFMVGAGWFITFDVDNSERRANRGLINGKYEVYRELTDAMKLAHDDLKKQMELKW